MSRRTIVVEGITYQWMRTRDGNAVAVFPPPGSGGTRVIPLPHAESGKYAPWWDDERVSVTPGLVSGLIYRSILGRQPPVRESEPPRRAPAPAKARPIWETDAEVPRTYLVMGRFSAPGLEPCVVPVEVHLDPETARRAAEGLNALSVEVKAHYRSLVAWHGNQGRRRMPVFRANWSGVTRTSLAGLDAWFDSARHAGANELDEVTFHATEIPFRVPVEAPGGRVGYWEHYEAARTLDRVRLQA